jgi:hypothetical protein
VLERKCALSERRDCRLEPPGDFSSIRLIDRARLWISTWSVMAQPCADQEIPSDQVLFQAIPSRVHE